MERVQPNTQPNGRHHIQGPSPGRPKGSVNRSGLLLKEALLLAAKEVGCPIPIYKKGKNGGNTQEIIGWKKGKGGLHEFLCHVALVDLRTFCNMLGRTIPGEMRLTGRDDGPLEIIKYKSPEEAKEALKQLGLPTYSVFIPPDAVLEAKRREFEEAKAKRKLDDG